jgi:DNA-binding LacI/PurR family transcriptional regulator
VAKPNRRTSSADVAAAAGVSKTSVSFAFNKPERLKPATAVRILEIAQAMGYRPDPVARMLTKRHAGTLGILTPQPLPVMFSNPFFSAFSEGVAVAADQSGYGLSFISPRHGSLAAAFGSVTVDGIVAIGMSPRHPEIEEVRRASLPTVMVDSGPSSEYAAIDVDDEGGARLAAEHLVGLGHRSFLVLGVEPPYPADGNDPELVMNRRLRGYRSAIEAAGMRLPSACVVVGPATIRGGYAAFERAWDDGLRPTAVLAMSDAMAIGAIRAMREAGLAVPRDVSVVGFDDLEIAELVEPMLTTIHQPVRRKGEAAARVLIAAIELGDAFRPEQLVMETRLIVRASSGPAPRRAAGARNTTPPDRIPLPSLTNPSRSPKR